MAQRAAFMGEKVNLEVKGVIENMSWFTGDDGKRYELFGAGGGAELAERLEVPLLGQVPLVQALREGSDSGRPIVAVDPDSEAARAIRRDRRARSTSSWRPPAATTPASSSSADASGPIAGRAGKRRLRARSMTATRP